MSAITFAQSPETDTNNNSKKGEKYSLRQRQRRQSGRNIRTAVATTSDEITPSFRPPSSTIAPIQTPLPQTKSVRKAKAAKAKPKAAPLSKYRRKTANARERTRMREINSAFENLRKCVPLSISSATPASTNEKLTKITTLRMAMKYIRTLNDVLNQPAAASFNGGNSSGDDNSCTSQFISDHLNPMSNNNHNNEINNNHSFILDDSSKDIFNELLLVANNFNHQQQIPMTHVASKKRKQSVKEQRKNYVKPITGKSPCLSPLDDNPMDLGLMLESDGESLHLSEPCLSPLSQNLKSFNCSANALELGLLLESDSDSLHLSEQCLSPLAGLDPFGDLLHSSFAEQSSLDMYLT